MYEGQTYRRRTLSYHMTENLFTKRILDLWLTIDFVFVVDIFMQISFWNPIEMNTLDLYFSSNLTDRW